MQGNRVLITGHHGYIGSVMAPLLMRAGYDVTGIDAGYFDECTLGPWSNGVPTLTKDIRDITAADLYGFEAVIHLAALSNDPIGNMNARWTREINLDGSVHLAAQAREAGVRRFLFSSSCIMYGFSDAPVVNEESPLDPRTEYARSKVDAERAIAALARQGFSPTFLRNGTVYGLSPRMRFDTVLNDLVGAALTEGRIVVHGDGSPWRPVVHVNDVARAFAAVLEAPLNVVHNQPFNTGADAANIQVADLARAVASAASCDVHIANSPGADCRSYRADFSKFARTFPRAAFRAPADGARELCESFASVPLTRALYRDPRFTRQSWLKQQLASGRLDDRLRRTAPVEAAQCQ